jgi:hypothetical protein
MSIVAGICFIAAFANPLVCSDFSLAGVPYVETAGAVIEAPCEEIIIAVREGIPPIPVPLTPIEVELDRLLDKIPLTDSDQIWGTATRACIATMDETLQDMAWKLMDEQLGLVEDPRGGDDLSWESCVAEVEDGADTRELGSCCQNEKDALQTCMKWWVVDRGGIPIGDQYLFEIIRRLFDSKDVALGLLITLFSICFPLLKVGLSLVLSLRPITDWSIEFLSITAKWSMTDVFIVALLITFFKADSFNFHFEAGTGLYFFAGGALLSSMAVMLLERSIKKQSLAEPDVE